MNSASSESIACVELSLVDYEKAHRLQKRIVDLKKSGELERDVLLLLEHPSVFTLGRRGGLQNLMVGKAFLARRDIAVVPVERGGDITYHGPGQLVAYPIFDLKRRRIKVVEFVGNLEEVMIRTAGDWNVRQKVFCTSTIIVSQTDENINYQSEH